MPIANSDQMHDPFPGIRWAGPPAPGSQGAAGDAADDTGAGPVTLPSGAWQPAARYPASTGGTVMPDQTAESQLSPGPESGYTGTGAGDGRAGHWKRYSWQQPDGGAA